MHIFDLEVIVEQLKPFLPKYLEDQGINTSKKFKCLDPDHKDSNASCNLTPDKQRFHCFGCGRGGDILDAVQLIEKKPKTGIEWVEDTLKYLATKYGVDVKTKELTEEEVYELDTYRAYRAAAALINADAPTNKLFQTELKKRGWSSDKLTADGIGTVSSYDDFYNALTDQGFPRKLLGEIDLNRKDIFNPGNVIFTWKDEKGRPIGFTARNMSFEAEKAEAVKNGTPYDGTKYNNQRTGLKCNIFQKGKRLYGIDKAIQAGPPLYIFEGQADVVTARMHGMANCVAIAGSALREDHIQLLKKLNIFDVVLCLDGDEAGQKALTEILETRFAGQRDMKVRVVILPPEDDPDSYIRKNSVKTFRAVAHWTAFEWRLNRYPDDADESEVCKQMIPFIVNEPSPIVRDKLCKALAKRTGISLKAIIEELNILLDEKAHVRSKERRDLLDSISYELKSSPEQAEIILQKAQLGLLDLTKRHDIDTLSTEDFIRALDEQKAMEEKTTGNDTSFKFGPELQEFEDVLRGNCSDGVFICLGGKPNVGKTAALCKIATAIAEHNSDVVVLYHTIDDTAEQLIPRLVTINEGNKKLSINMVRQPSYWTNTIGIKDIPERRDAGYKKLRALAQDGKIVIKDINHGASIPFIEHLITYYQGKYPDRRVVYILDNFHKLRDFETKDERVRFKKLSETMKELALRHRCTIFASVEYTKLAAGIKPTNHNIAESAQIEYDANAIIHLYSEVTDQPESFTVCHTSTDWKGNEVFLPRVEFIVGKNKISEQKRSFFLDFWPASSDYTYVDQKTVLEDAKAMKESKNCKGSDIYSKDELKAMFPDEEFLEDKK
jgi:DNA primase